MKTSQAVTTSSQAVPANKNEIKKMPLTVFKKRWMDNEVILNMGFRESLIRGAIVIMLPLLLLIIDPDLVSYATPIMF